MKLEALAELALKKFNGDVDKATPEFVRVVKAANLINDLARAYLSQIKRGSGQSANETRSAAAGPAPTFKPGSIRVSKHPVREHRRRTQAEKAAALAAAATSIEAVFEIEINGRAIGNLRIGELSTLRHELVNDASSKLMLGMEQARNAVLAELIENHATVPDKLARVRDVISAKALRALVQQADQEAPRRVSEAIRRAGDALDNRKIA